MQQDPGQKEKADPPCTVAQLIESLMEYPLDAPVVFDLGWENDLQDVQVPVPWVGTTPIADLSGDCGDCGYVRKVDGSGIRAVLLTWRRD